MRQVKQTLSAVLHWLNNLRLWYKILFLTVSLVLFSTILTGWYSYRVTARMVTEQAFAQSHETVVQAANFLDEKLRGLLWHSFFLQTNSAVQRAMTYEPGESFASEWTAIQNPLTNLRVRDRAVHSVMVSTPHADYFETVNIRSGQSFRETHLYKVASQHQGFTWFNAHPDPLFRGGRQLITLVLPVTVPEDIDDTYIIVNLSADWFYEYLSGVDAGEQSQVFLVDGNGRLVLPMELHPEADVAFLRSLPAARGTREVDWGEPYVVNHAPINAAGWQIISIQPKAALLAGANPIRVATGAIMAVALVISGLLSMVLANSIAKPLERLRSLMRQVEKADFATSFNARYDDEVGDLGRSFNHMTSRLNELVRQVEHEQQQKRYAELKALQAQMNPHFLYNTLDSIYWKAQLKDHQSVAEMVVSLSRLLRLGLNKGEEITTLGLELEHTDIYLQLQKRNYEHLFAYTVEASPGVIDVPCPKLILQPIVENSLLHGFSGMSDGGQIRVSAERDGDRVLITLTDNGRGLPEDTSPLETGFGLRNVQERLRLHFGPEYGVTFANGPGGGTQVTVTLPARTGGVPDVPADVG
ncbi:MAG: histidine kinase [Bacillota bacterium]